MVGLCAVNNQIVVRAASREWNDDRSKSIPSRATILVSSENTRSSNTGINCRKNIQSRATILVSSENTRNPNTGINRLAPNQQTRINSINHAGERRFPSMGEMYQHGLIKDRLVDRVCIRSSFNFAYVRPFCNNWLHCRAISCFADTGCLFWSAKPSWGIGLLSGCFRLDLLTSSTMQCIEVLNTPIIHTAWLRKKYTRSRLSRTASVRLWQYLFCCRSGLASASTFSQ